MVRTTKIGVLKYFALVATICVTLPTFAASFDCLRAKTSTERAICGDEELSDLDEAFDVIFRGALSDEGESQQIKTEQRQWLGVRNACGAGVECLRRAYESRIADLGAGGALFEADSLIMRCNGRTETATIAPLVKPTGPKPASEQVVKVPNSDVSALTVAPETWYSECLFGSGRSLRIKIGGTELWPYGRCGADPGSFFSLWVNQSKIVSRAEVRGDCGFSVLVKVVIGNASLKTCYASEDGKLSCKSTPIADKAGTRDTEEYPERKTPRPPLGSYVMEYSGKPELCKSMMGSGSADRNRTFWSVGPPASAITDFFDADLEPSGGHPPIVVFSNFDMNNDGKAESVVSIHYESGARESSTFLAQADNAVEKEGTEVDAEFLQEHTSLVFPHAWNGCRGGFNREEWDDESCTLPLKNLKTREFSYAVTHLRLRPFRMGGRTYFIGLEPHYQSGSVITVWEPKPSGAADEVCIFRHVVNNF
jgi:uncharacterized protein